MKQFALVVCGIMIAVVIGLNVQERYSDKEPTAQVEKEIVIGTRIDGNGQLQKVTRTYLVSAN